MAKSPAPLERRVRQLIELGEGDQDGNALVLAPVLRIYVRDDALDSGQVVARTLSAPGAA